MIPHPEGLDTAASLPGPAPAERRNSGPSPTCPSFLNVRFCVPCANRMLKLAYRSGAVRCRSSRPISRRFCMPMPPGLCMACMIPHPEKLDAAASLPGPAPAERRNSRPSPTCPSFLNVRFLCAMCQPMLKLAYRSGAVRMPQRQAHPHMLVFLHVRFLYVRFLYVRFCVPVQCAYHTCHGLRRPERHGAACISASHRR